MSEWSDRVAAGAAWLDVEKPDWWQKINLETLRLSSHSDCVLGQFWRTWHYAPLTWSEMHNMGFMEISSHRSLPGSLNYVSSTVAYELLENEWRRLIEHRRKHGFPEADA